MKKSNKSISKKERKFKWNDAKEVIKNGKKVKYQNILIAFQKSKEWRLRINITKNIKPAVFRNHIKRIIREVYRTSKPILNSPHQVVFTVLEGQKQLDFHDFKKKYIDLIRNNANN